MFREGLGMLGVEISKIKRLGGIGQNRNIKPRLLLAVLDTPNQKRAILAAAKRLRDDPEWSNVFITPDHTPKEREENKKLRDLLRTRRDNGEKDIVIRRNQIVKMPPRRPSTPNSPHAMNRASITQDQDQLGRNREEGTPGTERTVDVSESDTTHTGTDTDENLPPRQ